MPKKDILEKIKTGYKDLPDKKKYAEFVSAFMSIPIMATVLITNLNNLKKEKVSAAVLPTPTVTIVQKAEISSKEIGENKSDEVTALSKTSVTPTVFEISSDTEKECRKEIGPVEVLSPLEDERVEKDFVLIEIGGERKGYCDIVWSYRINGGNWSEFTDKAISIYNMESGIKKLEVKIRNLSGSEERVVERNFKFAGKGGNITPTEAQLTITPTLTTTPITGATNPVNSN